MKLIQGCYLAVKSILGETVDIQKPTYDILASYVEKSVVMNISN
nr:hypothetical protein [Paenibacillus sp. yr247]